MAEPAFILHRGVGNVSRCPCCHVLVAHAVHPTTGELAAFQLEPRGCWVLRNGDAIRITSPADLERDHTGAPETRYRAHTHASRTP